MGSQSFSDVGKPDTFEQGDPPWVASEALVAWNAPKHPGEPHSLVEPSRQQVERPLLLSKAPIDEPRVEIASVPLLKLGSHGFGFWRSPRAGVA